MPQLFDNNELDKQFRDAFEGARSVPSSRVWKRIEKALDKKPFYQQMGFWISAILVVSVTTFLTLFYLNNENTLTKKSLSSIPSKIQLNEKHASPSNGNQSVFPIITKQNLTNVRQLSGNIISSNNNVEVEIVSAKLNSTTTFTTAATKTNWHLTKIGYENKLIPVFPIEIVAIAKKENRFTPSKIKTDVNLPVNLKGFYVGTFGAYNNSWLYDKVAWQGNANLAYQYTQGYAIGFTSGYNFSNHFGIGGDVIIESKEGQKYFYRPSFGRNLHGNAADEVVYKRFMLNYFQIPLYAQFKFSRRSVITKQAIGVSLIFGVQYEHLKTAYMKVADVVSKSDILFNENGLDGIIGIDYEIHTAGKTFFTMGARSSFGMKSIFNSNSPSVPYEQFQEPHNMVFSARAAVNFSLAGK